MTDSKLSKIYIPVFFVLGYLGVQFGLSRVGFPLWMLLVYAAFLIYFRIEHGKLNPAGLWLSIAPILTLFAMILGDTALPPLAALAVLGMLVICGFVTIGTGHHVWTEPGFVSDVLIGMLYLPFGNLPAIYRTTWHALKPKQKGKHKELLIGISILVPILALSLFLLAQSDLLFSKALETIFEELRYFPRRTLWELIGAWILAMFLFSAVFGFFNIWKKKETETMPVRLTLKSVSVVLIPLIAVYCVFAGSQIYQMVLFYAGNSAYSGYAQYAREGFFTLVCAAGLNLAVVLGCAHFLVQEEKEKSLWKLCSRVFTALTFVVLICSLVRVCGYIAEYGMTRLRIQSLWGIFLIFLALCAVMWKLFSLRVRLFPILLGLVMFGYSGLCYVQSDALIASYNIHAYLDGRLQTVDFDVIEYTLSDDALIALNYLHEHLDAENSAYLARSKGILERARTSAKQNSWENITILQRFWSTE